MTVVHFTTELSGGAGNFVKNIHIAMMELKLPSLIITRERSDIEDSMSIKPMVRARRSLRARWRTILGKLGFLNTSYAMFGIEKAPVDLSDIQHVLRKRVPTAFIFYWISYFINFETILQLRQAYPKIPFLFVCTDEAFFTGGCHYSLDCLGYQKSCQNCPGTSLGRLKKKIERGYLQRQAIIGNINPFIIYPTTNIQQLGCKSAVFKNARSVVIPLGAISNSELSLSMAHRYRESLNDDNKKEAAVTLLIRSSKEYRKGCDLFVSALKLMDEKITDLRSRLKVISIGDETLLNAQINKYVDHVDLGYVTREELMSIYSKIDVFIVTSREDGGPLMINECVALGVFVISTPIGVAQDLIIEKQNGLITQAISSEAISEELIKLIFNYKTIISVLKKHKVMPLTFETYIVSIMNILKSFSSFPSADGSHLNSL